MRAGKILVVDDHPVYRLGLRTLLQDESGIGVVLEADSGPAAIELAEANQPDVALIDVTLLGMTGFETAWEIRQRSPRTSIIFLSIHRDPDLIREAYRVGAVDYVPKDDPSTRIVDSIREALSRAPGLGGAPGLEASPEITAGLQRLTSREREVMSLIAEGLPNKLVADRLDLSIRTVEVHRKNILQKMQLRSTAELVRRALQLGVKQ